MTLFTGPWTRQGNDTNCNVSAEVCAGMDPHPYDPDLKRPLGHLIVPAQVCADAAVLMAPALMFVQGTGISVLPSTGADAGHKAR